MSDCVADPWQVKNKDSIEKQQQKNGNIPVIEKFEDNFNPNKVETQTRKTHEENRDQKTESNVTSSQQQPQQQEQQQLEPLPDSANYLQLLGNIRYIKVKRITYQISILSLIIIIVIFTQREN